MAAFIKKDHIADGFDESRVGTTISETPLYTIERLIGVDDNMPEYGTLIPFRMYDDDDELYYEGELHDDPDCLNQMGALRWGETDAGCTRIEVLRDGKWTQEIG